MRRYGVVRGNVISNAKRELALDLRHEMTPEEKILWQYLRANRLAGFHFRRQQIIDGFIVDFYCQHVGVIVEIDGSVHQQQVEYDGERDAILMASGLRMIPVSNADIKHNLPDVLELIRNTCLKVETDRRDDQ